MTKKLKTKLKAHPASSSATCSTTRSLKSVVEEITGTFGSSGLRVVGYAIQVQGRKGGRLQMNWGQLRKNVL